MRPGATQRGGVVLIVVLWVVVVLAVVCLALGGTVRLKQAHLKRSGREAASQQALLSGAALAKTLLLADSASADTLSDSWAGNDPHPFTLVLGRTEVRLLADSPRWGLEDESARLNANIASAEMLAGLPGMTTSAAEAFVAARASARQAEGGQRPAGLTGPYATPAQLAEALVSAFAETGLSRSAGGPEPPSGEGGHGSWARQAQLPPAVAKVMKHLTVYSRQRNLDAEGRRRANINAAPQADLSAATAGHFSAEQIEAILVERAAKPFKSIGELLTRTMEITGPDGKPKSVRIGREQLKPVADRLTTTDAEILPGLVNVNTAPPEVLGCLPGLTEAGVSTMISHRSGVATSPGGAGPLASIGWLLDVLSEEAFAEVCSFVTTRSQQFRMRAKARPEAFPSASGTYRGSGGSAPAVSAYVLAVLERDAGRCSVLFWLMWTAATRADT